VDWRHARLAASLVRVWRAMENGAWNAPYWMTIRCVPRSSQSCGLCRVHSVHRVFPTRLIGPALHARGGENASQLPESQTPLYHDTGDTLQDLARVAQAAIHSRE